MLRNFDIVQEAGGARRAVKKTFQAIKATDTLTVEFTVASPGGKRSPNAPILSAFELRDESPKR